MTNDEWQKKPEFLKFDAMKGGTLAFGFPYFFGIRHSGFVII